MTKSYFGPGDSTPRLGTKSVSLHRVAQRQQGGAMSRAPNPRLREVMAAFVRHLHAFAREVRLTQDEYDLAVDLDNQLFVSRYLVALPPD